MNDPKGSALLQGSALHSLARERIVLSSRGNYAIMVVFLQGIVMSKRFCIVSLGCRSNQYESQAFRRQLGALGYIAAGDGECADVCIVNTCCVTASAEQRSRYQIRKIAKENPGAVVCVTGCMATRVGDIPEATHCIPNSEKQELVSCLVAERPLPDFSIDSFEGHTRAFVKVQDGCDSFCSYCIIPFVRGRSVSRPLGDIVCEVKRLVAGGYKEVVLTGINIGDYGDGGKVLSDLVRGIDGIDSLRRLRLSSIDPTDINDALFDAVVNGKTTCNSLHMVLQSGSDATLQAMKRKYRREEFLATAERFLAEDSDFSFTTDVIIGFPGETEEDFAETVDVVQQVPFSHVHIFPYSPRPGVQAASLGGAVDSVTVRRRKEEFADLAEHKAHVLREEYVGRVIEVLTEENKTIPDGYSYGHSRNFLPVAISSFLPANTLAQVKIVGNDSNGLQGAVI